MNIDVKRFFSIYLWNQREYRRYKINTWRFHSWRNF